MSRTCTVPRLTAAFAFVASLSASTVSALTIDFDYRFDDAGFFAEPDARATLEAAGGFFSPFTDSLAPIRPSGRDTWSVSVIDPGRIGATVTLVDEPVAMDTLKVFVGGSGSFAPVLGVADSGFALSASGGDAFVASVERRASMPMGGPIEATPWGGAIWFNTSIDWHFGLDPVAPDAHDFLTTAIHELAHLLGIGDSLAWDALTDAQTSTFVGPHASAVHGGPVPLDALGAHLAEGIVGLGPDGPQEALMDPSTPRGVRQLPTDLDYALLADLGWEVPTPVPAPPALALVLAPLGIVACRRHGAERVQRYPGTHRALPGPHHADPQGDDDRGRHDGRHFAPNRPDR